MKALVIFYSNGSHTRNVARLIAKKYGCDLEEIYVCEPYGEELMSRSKLEIMNNNLPSIRTLVHNVEAYDTIFLGTPIWWLAPASPVLSFIKENDLSNKVIYPFITTGWDKSGIMEKLKELLPNSILKEPLYVSYTNAFADQSDEEINAWLEANVD